MCLNYALCLPPIVPHIPDFSILVYVTQSKFLINNNKNKFSKLDKKKNNILALLLT